MMQRLFAAGDGQRWPASERDPDTFRPRTIAEMVPPKTPVLLPRPRCAYLTVLCRDFDPPSGCKIAQTRPPKPRRWQVWGRPSGWGATGPVQHLIAPDGRKPRCLAQIPTAGKFHRL